MFETWCNLAAIWGNCSKYPTGIAAKSLLVYTCDEGCIGERDGNCTKNRMCKRAFTRKTCSFETSWNGHYPAKIMKFRLPNFSATLPDSTRYISKFDKNDEQKRTSSLGMKFRIARIKLNCSSLSLIFQKLIWPFWGIYFEFLRLHVVSQICILLVLSHLTIFLPISL